MKKIYADARAALDGMLFEGMLIASGGFGLYTVPERRSSVLQTSGVGGLAFRKTAVHYRSAP